MLVAVILPRKVCASESIIVHSSPRPRCVVAVDSYVAVPMRIVFTNDVEILPAVSCLCVHTACSSYLADIIVATSRKVLWYSTPVIPFSFTGYHTLAGGAHLHI